jgi:DNA-binding NtrC family response regulator
MRVLVVEADNLTRWSLTKYLARWFQVLPADSMEVATRILDAGNIDALVVSDDLPDCTAEALLARARERNPAIRVVCTVTDSETAAICQREAVCVEKPFDLSALAGLLGVTTTVRPEKDETGGCS